MNFKDFLNFDRLLSPSLIRIGYWVGIVLITISGLVGFMGAFASYGGGLGRALLALAGTVLGLIIWRVICEGAILVFSLNDRLAEIRDRLPAGRD
ncbi:hypothetical protein L861_09965 [Litchfieldella anticariensis FP35 = DSM 16096]|uniref:DUF4282 domain-containing protein n=1 Tax=Litchfieldella anticariensis (strain DSM 16096 / CECT 5854 / CIP 108499 / LMG 22089 / FP35) TaxID=1121939 RepID=S2KL43_LITA3|nr:DUF4282 domain-containing protein [Halomonas anticariensis]EPC02660.1 hypothetical protein L861_09965 [Halomonas anticariensis FP35 = DSM 16096]